MSMADGWTLCSSAIPMLDSIICASKYTMSTASPTCSAPPSPQAQGLRPKKKAAPLGMSLAERNKEDDWTRVKDPKEKKRIQNRVAQRTYRHRMKARLGELQARLDSHERRGLNQEGCESPSDAAMSWPANNGSEAACGLQMESSAGQNMSLLDGTSSKEESSKPSATATLSTESSPSPESADGSFGGSFMNMLTAGMAGDEATTRLYGGARSFLDNPEASPGSMQGVVSPPAQGSATRPVKISQDFVLDCLRFQNHLLSRLSRIQQQQEQQDAVAAAYGGGGGPDSLTPELSLTPAHSDAMDLSFHDSAAMWDLGSLDASSPAADPINFMSSCPGEQRFPAMPQPAPVLPCALPPQPTALVHGQATTPASTPASSPCKPPLAGDASLHRRIESVLKQAEAVGFESLDQLVAAYYCGSFDEASPLASHQLQSRRRRLPRLLSDVFRATGQWSPWERRGFHDEVLRTAEALLRAEASDFYVYVP
ncbi:hypothetical protein CDD81_2574 [Ophiocordyceps australis]|uniref:BZIP domain-containing protein n=1 Tax=Ophiocordyceps australis TaxID=1399860 RepID=A0A2C5XTN9_9HYPO|nr:hypothetical protein CDD81_2574 [Ophiocordyceps australis]